MASRAWRPGSRSWRIAPPFDGAKDLARRLGTAPLVAQVLANRGMADLEAARAFMKPSLNDLHDPLLLGGARQAAGCIAQAVADKKRIVIYGDYDVDGITGVAILHACLRMVGAEAGFYVPHRLEEGYGVNTEAVGKIADDGADVLVTVDCGISAIEPLAEARRRGLQVVVTDHHDFGDELPEADAIVHPRLAGSQYPNPNLSGSGVAFKVAWQLAREICGNDRVDQPMRDFLLNATCLAALGTIADVVPLVGENRALVVHGLRGLPASTHPGLRALLESSGLADEKVDAYHVGFILAPRINACGRMGHASLAVEMLTDAPEKRCREIARYLAEQNAERQRIQRRITREAIEMVESDGLGAPDRRAIVVWSDQWHGGIIGVVASRLVEQYGRPAIMLAINGEGIAQGSGRSIPGFNMRDALAACSENLISFGGHAMAGGLRLEPNNIARFAEAFCRYAAENIDVDQLGPPLAIDAEVALAELSYPVVEHLARLAPFGQGNPDPIVAVRNCRMLTPPKRIGRKGDTVSLMLGQDQARIRAVGFGMGQLADLLVGADVIDVAGQPMLNTFNGTTSVELKLADVNWR